MRANKIKQMWRDGKCASLGWLSVSHGFTAEVMARQGFDALCVDLQHGTSELSDIYPMLQAISQTDTTPIVRVAWNEPAAIMKALDMGAYGVIVPLVNTAEEAAQAVAACRYPPVGMRSSGPIRAAQYGGAGPVPGGNDPLRRLRAIKVPQLLGIESMAWIARQIGRRFARRHSPLPHRLTGSPSADTRRVQARGQRAHCIRLAERITGASRFRQRSAGASRTMPA